MTRECLTFSREGVEVKFGKRFTATAVQIRFVASKCDKKRAGCTITRTWLSNERGIGEGSVDGGLRSSAGMARCASPAPRRGAADSLGHVARLESFTRMEAVTALRLMVGCSSKDPMQFALHSGRIGGGHPISGARISELQIQRAGKWKSRVFMTYVREAGEGAEAVSAALARTQQFVEVRLA